MHNGTQKHYLCDVQFVFNAPCLGVSPLGEGGISLLLLGEKESLLIQMDPITMNTNGQSNNPTMHSCL